MKICKMMLMVVAVVALVTRSLAEGTVAETNSIGSPTKTTLYFTSGTNLTRTGSAVGDSTSYIQGTIERVVISCVSTGTYSAYIYDDSGVDILGGQGASLASNTVYSFVPATKLALNATTSLWPTAVNDIMSVFVTNIGPAHSGWAAIYHR